METEIEKPYVIGLDMGGTNSVFGIVDQRGTIKSQTVISTRAYSDFKDYVKASVEALQPALDTVGGIENVRAIGIGAPNANYYTGTIENAANLVWRGSVPCAQMFEDALGIPCRITNDANAAAMGEMTYGVARGMKNFIMITLGTGVGSGIVCDGKVVYGSDGFAGELGHVIIDHSGAGRSCGCGRKGCLETYTSATGVARTARELLETRTEPSLLRELAPEKITSFDVFQAAEKGDAIANDPAVKAVCAMLWACLGLCFVFILVDFGFISAYKKDYRELDFAVHSDPLSGLANRHSCDRLIEKYLDKPLPKDVGCVMVELSNIMQINEEFGHAAGNDTIRDFSNILKMALMEGGSTVKAAISL